MSKAEAWWVAGMLVKQLQMSLRLRNNILARPGLVGLQLCCVHQGKPRISSMHTVRAAADRPRPCRPKWTATLGVSPILSMPAGLMGRPTARPYAVATDVEEAAVDVASAPTVPVLLTVTNMKCGGCSAAVKRILLQQPGVANAAVNLLTETAVVELRTASGEDVHAVALQTADALTSKGFPAQPRAADDEGVVGTSSSKDRKEQELQET